MKKLAAILCLSALTTGAFAQGLVTFANGPTTLISATIGGVSASTAAGAPGSYYYALLTNGTATGTFSFAGLMQTNSASAGRIGPTYTTTVNGWAPGQALFYEVAGWSASLGTTWNPAWLTGNFGGKLGNFGVSVAVSGTAGGGSPPAPAWNLFGGTGLQGFNLPSIVPEPSSMALAGLGAAALLIFRRRK